ncbi:MAG: hypothetical protein HKN90_03040 [Flavobacteriaceae bacterium]|nr:hypothetical protein [Flavobacteriaceae bacterium]
MFLDRQLNEIEALIKKAHTENSRVSKKGIDWHLDHSLKVLINIPKALHNSNPKAYKSNFNFLRFLIYTLNYIPRGTGKAPKHVRTFDPITKEQLIAQFEQAKEALKQLDGLDKNSHFQHPYFGILNLKQSKKMMRLHTDHHLKICREIVK